MVIAADGIARRQLRAIGRHVDELVTSGDVPRRVDAGGRGLEVVIDEDPALGGQFDALRLQPHAVTVRPAACRDQHLLCGDDLDRRIPVASRAHVGRTVAGEFDTVVRLYNPLVADPGAHPDALCFQISLKGGAELRIHLG